MTRVTFPILALAAFVLALMQMTAPARANGVPQLVKLTYLSGVSNWGPENAEGVLEFSFAEAYARIDVKNLPPQEGSTLDGWLVAPDGSAFYLGPVTSNSEGIGRTEIKLEGLERYDYDLFVIAGRTGKDVPAQPPATRSIAGRFTIIKDTTTSTQGNNDTFPTSLPDTGEAAADGPGFLTRSSVTFVAMAVAGVAIVVVRTVQRRNARD